MTAEHANDLAQINVICALSDAQEWNIHAKTYERMGLQSWIYVLSLMLWWIVLNRRTDSIETHWLWSVATAMEIVLLVGVGKFFLATIRNYRGEARSRAYAETMAEHALAWRRWYHEVIRLNERSEA